MQPRPEALALAAALEDVQNMIVAANNNAAEENEKIVEAVEKLIKGLLIQEGA